MAATVTVTIVGRSYELACDEGQEHYLRNLAGEVDRRAGDLLRAVGQVGDARLLVMVALSLMDEVNEHRDSHAAELRALAERPVILPEPEIIREVVHVIDEAADAALAEGIDSLARHIEAIAERLERA